MYERLDFSAIGKDKIDPRKVELRWEDDDIRQLIAFRVFYNLHPILRRGKALKFQCNEEQFTIDRAFLEEIRAIDSIPVAEQSFFKRVRRAFIMLKARLKQRKRDAYDARTTNVHDAVHRAILLIFFPPSVNHKSKAGKEEPIELAQFISTHFRFSNDYTTPRVMLLYLQKCLEVARNYYRCNPETEIAVNDHGVYPIFLRDHLASAYQEVRQLALQTALGLHQHWVRPASALMQVIAKSKDGDEISFKDARKHVGKALGGGDQVTELSNFFAFYEHVGVFRCCNRAEKPENRVYKIPLFFQRVQLANF